MSELRIGRGIAFPEEAVTQTFGILAKRGAGKSNTAAVMAEEMHRAQLPFVVVDPVGAWWGLRSSGDGKGPGLSIPIFGGHRGDVPLERGGAELVADVIVDESLSCVLDVSAFESERAKREFLIAFAERLFRRKGQPGKGTPLHLFLEEADDYAPQRHMGVEMARCLGAFQRIVKQGRARGLGSTMISQRSASLNKDLLTQIETLIVLRTTSPQDRKAIAAWVEYHAQSEDLLSSLHELADGEAWVWSPWLNIVKRVQVRRRSTFDSGATPTLKARRAPATLADVDLDVLRTRMASTIEKAKAEDPRELRRRIVELERELVATRREADARQPEQITVEVPVLANGVADRLASAAADLKVVAEQITGELRKVLPGGAKQGTSGVQSGSLTRRPVDARRTERPVPPRASTTSRAGRPGSPPASLDDVQVKAGARRILHTLARHYPMRMTRAQLGTLARFKITGGTFQAYYSLLRRLDLIDETAGEISITQEGLDFIGEVPPAPQTTEETLAMWRSALKAGARRILDELVDVYPKALDREELAARVEMTAAGGTFQTYVGTLRRNGLAEIRGSEISASDSLFLTSKAGSA